MAYPEGLREDVSIWPALVRLSECLCAELGAMDGPGLCFCGVVHGDEIPLDLMEKQGVGTGLAWTLLVNGFPSTNFPDPDPTWLRNAGWAYVIELGVARCVPIGTATKPPSVQERFNATRLQLADMAAMKRAIRCCFATSSADVAIADYQPIPTSGGIGGGRITLTVGQNWK